MPGLSIAYSISFREGLKRINIYWINISRVVTDIKKSQQKLPSFQNCISIFPNISKWYIKKDMFKYIVLNI